jgi:hypothetical protein
MEAHTRRVERELNKEERTLLEWLVANGSPEALKYAPQVSDLRVVGTCTCGCPTLDLAPRARKEKTTGRSHVLADFDGLTQEGVRVGVILHAREGYISELEVYAIEDFEGSFSLPTTESLKPG